jgi:hypothetical protein
MLSKKEELYERLQREFERCERHILRINEALSGLRVEIPISEADYVSFTPEQVRCVDQFIFRFSKLQDALGAKVFRYVLEYLDEDISALPMRDILNRMERYGIIPDVNEWSYIRELRNEISHDYPLAEHDVLDALNELFTKVPLLFDIYRKVKGMVEK